MASSENNANDDDNRNDDDDIQETFTYALVRKF